MSQFLLVAAVALTVGAIVFGVTVLIGGDEGELRPVEPDGRAVPLPATRPLAETDLAGVQFDAALRGYRMRQVDTALRRAAYDIGYKDELIRVLIAETAALREGRTEQADELRRSREAALAGATELIEPPAAAPVAPGDPAGPTVDATVPPAARDSVDEADKSIVGDGSGSR